MNGHSVEFQIGSGVNEHLVDAVNVNVLWRDVIQIDGIDFGGYLDVLRHAGHGGDVVDHLPGAELVIQQNLIHLKQPGPSGNPLGL